jgi:hypothetical protein
MLTFTKFLIEKRASKAATAEVSCDDKGKLHELLLAKHLIKHQDPNGEGFLPQHFRAGKDHPNKKIKGKSPQEVHDDIRSRIGEAAYNEINGHAAQTAESIVQHAIRTGRIKSRKDITNVHWTSNRDTFKKAGDHENLTGQKDVNANGDLILTTKHPKIPGEKDFIPVSAKYGSEDKPNFRNDGLDGLEDKAGLDRGKISGIQADMERELSETYGERHKGETQEKRHENYKKDLAVLEAEQKAHKNKTDSDLETFVKSGGKKKDFVKQKFQPQSEAAKAAVGAAEIGVKHRRKMAAALAEGFSKMKRESGSDEPLRRFIDGQVSPSVRFQHIIAHSHVQPDASAVSVIHDMHHIGRDHLSNFRDIEAVHGSEDGEEGEGGGVSVNFYGTHVRTNRRQIIATQSLKGGSGPYKGSNGTFRINPPVKEKDQEASSIVGKPIDVPSETPLSNATIKTPEGKPSRSRAAQPQPAAQQTSQPSLQRNPSNRFSTIKAASGDWRQNQTHSQVRANATHGDKLWLTPSEREEAAGGYN